MPTKPRKTAGKRPRKPRTSRGSSPRRTSAKHKQATRNAESANDTNATTPIAADARPLVARRPRPTSTPASERASRNLFDRMGGADTVAPLLRKSGRPKALMLADFITSRDFLSLGFAGSLHQVGMNLVEFTETLLDVRNAAVVARLLTSGDEVAETIIERATDQLIPHHACLGGGRIIDDEGQQTPLECFDCEGTGWVLRRADGEWVDRYLELVNLKKGGGMNLNIDNRRQQLTQIAVAGDLNTTDGAPSVDAIIKKADAQQIMLPPATSSSPSPSQLIDGSERLPVMMGMPEDAVDEAMEAGLGVVEAEVVV